MFTGGGGLCVCGEGWGGEIGMGGGGGLDKEIFLLNGFAAVCYINCSEGIRGL